MEGTIRAGVFLSPMEVKRRGELSKRFSKACFSIQGPRLRFQTLFVTVSDAFHFIRSHCGEAIVPLAKARQRKAEAFCMRCSLRTLTAKLPCAVPHSLNFSPLD